MNYLYTGRGCVSKGQGNGGAKGVSMVLGYIRREHRNEVGREQDAQSAMT